MRVMSYIISIVVMSCFGLNGKEFYEVPVHVIKQSLYQEVPYSRSSVRPKVNGITSSDYPLGYYRNSPPYKQKKEDLFSYSAEQLSNYFFRNGYSVDDILAYDALYSSSEFIKLIKKYPKYNESVINLHHKLVRMTWVGKAWWFIDGIDHRDLSEKVFPLYKAVVDDIQKNICPQSYEFASLYNIDFRETFPHSSGAAQGLYKEYIDICNRANAVPKSNMIARDCIGQAAKIGLDANKHGHIKPARKLADFCWAVLDIGMAFGEGMCVGTLNSIDAVIHPIRTIQDSLVGLAAITCQLGKLTCQTGNLLYLYITDDYQYFLRQLEVLAAVEKSIASAEKYLSSRSLRNVVKDGTAFLTEAFFLKKIGSFALDISKQLKPISLAYMQRLVDAIPGPNLKPGCIKILSEAAKKRLLAAAKKAEIAALNAALKAEKDLVPLGKGNTGRTIPNNLHEQIAMQEIIANPAQGVIISIKKGMTDPRWPQEKGWFKMSWEYSDTYIHSGVQIKERIDVHFVAQIIDNIIVAIDDFKFKDNL